MSLVSSNPVQRAFESVFVFNDVAENLYVVSPESIVKQLEFIQEELNETFNATMDSDDVEVLDGACDLFVTVAGLLAKLEVAGFNVSEALHRVCDNNISKYPKTLEGLTFPEGHEAEYNGSYCLYVIKNQAGKIMKPSNFVPVDLSDLVPVGFF